MTTVKIDIRGEFKAELVKTFVSEAAKPLSKYVKLFRCKYQHTSFIQNYLNCLRNFRI